MEKSIYDDRVKDHDDLIQLFITVAKYKVDYRYDPQKMILSLLPDRATAFASHKISNSYSLERSIKDIGGQLLINEHRFINYLKFNPFSQEEINKVFDVFKTQRIDEAWEYSVDQVWSFLVQEKQKGFVLTDEEVQADLKLMEDLSKENDNG